jgi:uncharacterized membrane protein YkvA (DUF1232 family)
MDHRGTLDHDPRRMLYFEPYTERARTLIGADDADALTEIAGRAQRKLGDSRDPFVLNVRDRADRLARFVKAFAAGRAVVDDGAAIEFAVAALVYFLSPTDQVPDARPGGQTDDAAVLAFAARELQTAVDATLGA